MPILDPTSPPASVASRFRTPPWQDDHPQRRDLEQCLGPDHLARRIDAAVDRLDLSALQHSYAGTGSRAYPPAPLLKAVLYAVRRGRHRPSQWSQDARENAPLRWLLRGLTPSRARWYTFRDRLAPYLDDYQQQVLGQAIAQALTPARRGALDGTTVAANATRHKLVSETTLQQRVEHLATVVAAETAGATAVSATAETAAGATAAGTPAAAEAATAESAATATAAGTPAAAEAATAESAATATAAGTPPARPAWMARHPASRRRQQRQLEQAQQHMATRQERNRQKRASKRTARERIVLAVSDPEAAVSRDKEGVFRPFYNVQVLDDLDSPFILGYEVLGQPNDAGLLGPLLTQLPTQLGQQLDVVLVDPAYAGGPDLAAAAALGVTVYAALGTPDAPAAPPKQLPKSAFAWLPEAQTYVCPQGHRLVLERVSRQRRSGPEAQQVASYRCPPTHCQQCPLRQHCTPNPAQGRTISRSEHEAHREALQARMASVEAKALYKQRGQTVELVNADWKSHRELRRFSGRGRVRARGAIGLVVLAHNLITLLQEEAKASTGRRPADAPTPGPDTA